MSTARFGAQRLYLDGAAQALLFRVMGVADPAHYLHGLYFRRALDRCGASFRPRRILDAGCGRGDYTMYLAQRYPEAEVLGVDLDAKRIARNVELAKRMGLANARFEVADLAARDWGAEFDLIVSVDVLEHIPQQPVALKRLASALRPGGYFFAHLPTVRERPVPFASHLQAFEAWAEEEHLAEDRTADEFVHMIRDTGLEIRDQRRTFGWWTGELATSLFALPFENTPVNRVLQAALAPVCRVLALGDTLALDRTRYAVAVLARASGG